MSDSDTNTSSQSTSKYSAKSIPTRDLIRMVHARRCIWDRKLPEYRDKALKERMWYEIYTHFEPNLDSFDEAKKNFIGHIITGKWHNARDSYVKARKNRNKPYLYSEELRFLEETLGTKRQRKGFTYAEETQELDQDESQNWVNKVLVDIDEQGADNNTPSKKSKLTFDMNVPDSPKETTKEDFDDSIVSVLINLIQKEEDEDRAFFKSITPSVKTLSDNSKFEFRIQVMKLIQHLKMRDKGVVRTKKKLVTKVESDSE